VLAQGVPVDQEMTAKVIRIQALQRQRQAKKRVAAIRQQRLATLTVVRAGDQHQPGCLFGAVKKHRCRVVSRNSIVVGVRLMQADCRMQFDQLKV
jgi:hypothetical protein